MLIACHATHGTCPFADSCSSSLNREDCLIDSFWFSISHFTSPCLDGLSGRELWPDPIAARKTSSASATSWQRTSWVLPQLVLPPIDIGRRSLSLWVWASTTAAQLHLLWHHHLLLPSPSWLHLLHINFLDSCFGLISETKGTAISEPVDATAG